MAEFAGDYDLQYVHIHNHRGEGLNVDQAGNIQSTRGENISNMVIEVNIYESLYTHAITGSLVIVDTRNLIGNLPIQGTERLSFRLATKLDTYSSADSIDFTEERGNPMHVYKLANREQLNDTTQKYTLHFCSKEFLRNMRTRVSKSYSGRMDEAVNSIFKDPEYLNSKKKLFFQKTRNQDKIVIPNLSPVDAIKLLGKRSLPSNVNNRGGAGYLFYETTKGFHFRSFESLCVTKNGEQVAAKQKFRYVHVPIDITGHEMIDEKTGKKLDKIMEGFKSVIQYKFLNNVHDVATNTVLGTYGHTVITHNLYDKSYKKDKYHYHNSYNTTAHTDTDPKHRWKGGPPITDSPVDYDQVEGNAYKQKGVSDFAESRISLQPTTRFSHNEGTGSFGVDVTQDGKIEGERVALANSARAGTKRRMTIKGQSWLQPGDIIEFDVLSVENKRNTGGRPDPRHSGRYIITHIRHKVNSDQYFQEIECIKDSVRQSYGSANKSYANIAGDEKRPVIPHDIENDTYS
jgi:hypothetical protein